jgi:protein-S-isoprenylcysteine O-methyltransferase Ste14
MPYHLPALLLGLIVGAYWARVVKMVLKQRRQTGRDANFVPREKLGKALRIIWYPAVVLWILVPFLIACTVWRGPLLKLPSWSIAYSWIAVMVAFACLVLTWICWKKMGKSWRMGIDPNEKTLLIVTGPYAYVRHPIYGLQMVMALASILTVPSIAMLIICGIIIFFLAWEARREEQYLLGVQGDAYGEYMKRVAGFMPRSLTPYRPSVV